MNDQRIDEAAESREDYASMVESTVDRQIFAEMKNMQLKPNDVVQDGTVVTIETDEKQPQATDFLEIRASCTVDGEFNLCVILDSGSIVPVGHFFSRAEVETAELAISQAMIEYRTKRNDWNNRH